MATGAVVSLRLTFVRRRLSYLSPWVLVKCRTFRPLLITLYSHDDNTPAQDRSQLGVAVFADLAVIGDVVIDLLRGLTLKPVCNQVERPPLFVLDRALDKFLGEAVDLLALVLIVRIDAVQFEAQRVGEYLFARFAARIA